MAVKELIYEGYEFKISYSLKNTKEKKDLVILHGWGSNKELMQHAFENTFSDYRHIYIDLPGFGGSSNDKMVLNALQYSEIISAFLKLIKANIKIAMGHSFGGKIATLLFPENLILLSSAGIKEPKTLRTKLKIFSFKILKPFGMGLFHPLFVAKDGKKLSKNMYETFKLAVNEPFEHRFKEYVNKATLFWGREDTATPLSSGEKINHLIPNSKLYILEGDHYFFLEQGDLIEKLFLQRVEQ